MSEGVRDFSIFYRAKMMDSEEYINHLIFLLESGEMKQKHCSIFLFNFYSIKSLFGQALDRILFNFGSFFS